VLAMCVQGSVYLWLVKHRTALMDEKKRNDKLGQMAYLHSFWLVFKKEFDMMDMMRRSSLLVMFILSKTFSSCFS
jgi:hypothetical protein